MIINPYAFGGAAPTDPDFANVKALLHFNGAHDSLTITDEIPGHSWACLANARLTTANSKFGSASLYLDGASDSVEATSADFAIGTADFTDEFWIYPTNALPSNWMLLDQRPDGTQGLMPTIYASGSTLKFFTDSADRIAGGTIALNTWQHVEYSRASGTGRLFLGGTFVGSWSDSNNYAATRIRLGTSGVNGGLAMDGLIDDYRRTVGSARHTSNSNFTPPTAEFPNS